MWVPEPGVPGGAVEESLRGRGDRERDPLGSERVEETTLGVTRWVMEGVGPGRTSGVVGG